MPPTPSSSNNNDRREEARRALAGEERYTEIKASQTYLEKRRQEAMRAMEGEVGRKRREVRDFQRRQRELSAATEAEESIRTTEAKEWKVAQEKSMAEKRQREEQKTEQNRLQAIEQSKAIVEDLRKEAASISPMRTLKTDMARAVREEGVSIASIATSQQARNRLGTSITPEQKPKSNLGLLLLLTILIVAAGGAGGYLWWQQQAMPALPPPSAAAKPPEIIFAEASEAIDLTGLAGSADIRRAISAKAAAADFGSQAVKQLYFARNNVALNASQLITALDWRPPAALVRTFNAPYMFGVYNDGTSNHRFLILTTSLYDQAFAGMLEWEQTMTDELLPFLHDIPAGQPAPATTEFKDKLVRNKDTRYTTNPAGETLLFYAFLDQHTIAITPNEQVFLELFGRFANSQ